MTPDRYLRWAIRPALEILPDQMSSPEAEAMMLSIALQESGLRHRLQVRGPARGYSQWEWSPGVRQALSGLLLIPGTRDHAANLCAALDQAPRADQLHQAIAYNDILNAGMTRLLLWEDPKPLPLRGDVDGSWSYYLRLWRPGKKRPQTWPGHYAAAWETVAGPVDDGRSA